MKFAPLDITPLICFQQLGNFFGLTSASLEHFLAQLEFGRSGCEDTYRYIISLLETLAIEFLNRLWDLKRFKICQTSRYREIT